MAFRYGVKGARDGQKRTKGAGPLISGIDGDWFNMSKVDQIIYDLKEDFSR